MQASTHPIIAFVGAGNMAFSLTRGLLSDGHPATHLRVADPLPEALAKYSTAEITTFTDNNLAIQGADVVVLAVKPQVAPQVTSELAISSNQLLVSIAAGVSLQSLNTWTSDAQPIVRCMPNTPALLGAGMSGLYANTCCSPEQKGFAEQILQAGGTTLWVHKESELDAVTAVSGSGPAYFFRLMEAMIEAGEALGLSRETATILTLQTAYGAALMAKNTDEQPATLRHNVTSPGGTTAAALAVMEKDDLGGLIQRALSAAHARSIALAEEFGTGSN